MIRKPIVADAEWIYELIHTEFPELPVTADDVRKWIESEQVVVDDSNRAFLKWTKRPGFTHIDLSITHKDYRSRGLSTILYSYVAYTFQKPVAFTVQGSGDEYVTRDARLIIESTDGDGRTWSTYTKRH